MRYIDFDKTGTYKKLSALPAAGKDFSALLTAERVRGARIAAGGGLPYSWAAKAVERAELDALQALAE